MLGLVLIVFLLIISRRVSGLTTGLSQCAVCPTKPSGTYYTTVNGCTTAACVTCPAVANGNNVLTPCTDATAANPTGSPGSCTLTCNQGFSKSSDGASCTPDCIGTWGSCSTTCGQGEYTYRITTPAGPGGKPCKDTDGTVRNDGDKKPCSNPDCPQNCVGSWSTYGACSSICGYGTKTRKFTATQTARNGGAACETTYGLNAHYPESYETTTCTDLPACQAGLACQGEWSGWSACSQPCNGGVQTRTYNVTRQATVGTDGTRGAACPYADGERQTQTCNSQDCCSLATVGAWQKQGSVHCSGNSSGKPEQNYVRNIVFPAGTPVNTTASSCSINQFYTKYTAAGCPDVAPSAGTCSVTGATWSATGACQLPATDPTSGTCSDAAIAWNKTTGCAVSPATQQPSAGECNLSRGGIEETPFKTTWGLTSLGSWKNFTPVYAGATITWTKDNGCVTNPEYWTHNSGPQFLWGSCGVGIAWQKTPWYEVCQPLNGGSSWNAGPNDVKAIFCGPGYTQDLANKRCNAIKNTVATVTCPAGYDSDVTNNRCNAKSLTISTLTCPANYTADKTNNKCTPGTASITGLTCPGPYWSENRTINMCSATTEGDSAPKNTATGD